MEISVKLQAFEGPLDLLLHLIDKNKVSIMDIPIASITDQYLEYLAQMRREDLDVMSEFLVMAATLLDIKSRMLLPPEKDEEGEEIDPRAELVEKLLEYKMYKHMSGQMRGWEEDAAHTMYREGKLPDEVRNFRAPVDTDELLDDVTLAALHTVFLDVMKRQADRVDPIRSNFGRIEKEDVDVRSVMSDVQHRIMKKRSCSFKSLLAGGKGRMYTVVTFLTVLELMRMGRIGVEQENPFGEIYITAKDEAQWDQSFEELELEEQI